MIKNEHKNIDVRCMSF